MHHISTATSSAGMTEVTVKAHDLVAQPCGAPFCTLVRRQACNTIHGALFIDVALPTANLTS